MFSFPVCTLPQPLSLQALSYLPLSVTYFVTSLHSASSPSLPFLFFLCHQSTSFPFYPLSANFLTFFMPPSSLFFCSFLVSFPQLPSSTFPLPSSSPVFVVSLQAFLFKLIHSSSSCLLYLLYFIFVTSLRRLSLSAVPLLYPPSSRLVTSLPRLPSALSFFSTHPRK